MQTYHERNGPASLGRRLRSVLLVPRQLEVILVQTLQGLFSILGKVRFAHRGDRPCEEPRLPLFIGRLPFCSLLSLFLFNLLFQRCSKRILFVDDGVGDTLPEFAALVGELIFHRRDVLRHGVQGAEVNEEDLFLCNGLETHRGGKRVRGLTEDLAKGWLPSV